MVSKYYCYILFSVELDRFYTGATVLDPEVRLENHLVDYYGNKKYTAKAKDWQLFMAIECATMDQARKIESHIKRMKSSTYIRNLIEYPEIIKKLQIDYL
jgi:putative endonuclease